jgi:hypothetical protein
MRIIEKDAVTHALTRAYAIQDELEDPNWTTA